MSRLETAMIAIATVSAFGCAAAQATTITFDEFPATNGSPLTTLYSPVGISFGGSNGGVWGGIANGDPGNWDVDGTNGPQFLGFNGPYADTITLDAYSGATLVATVSTRLGPVNDWSTLSLTGAGIDRIELSGVGSAFHPYGVDNIVFDGGAVPEPAAWVLMIAGFGLVGAAQRRRRTIRLSFG